MPDVADQQAIQYELNVKPFNDDSTENREAPKAQDVLKPTKQSTSTGASRTTKIFPKSQMMKPSDG